LKRRDFVRLASVGLVIAAFVPADAASIATPKTAPATNRHTIAVSQPTLASPPLTTAAERVPLETTPSVRTHNPAVDAQRFIELINEARKAHGLAPLRSRKDLRTIAVHWSARMAAEERIWHNHALRNEVFGWWRLGENVGWAAGSVEYLHQAFLASPEHRRNILDPLFTSIGVAETVSADGRIFVVEDFGRFSRL